MEEDCEPSPRLQMVQFVRIHPTIMRHSYHVTHELFLVVMMIIIWVVRHFVAEDACPGVPMVLQRSTQRMHTTSNMHPVFSSKPHEIATHA